MGPRDQVGGATPHVDSRHPAGSGVDSHRGHVHRFQPHHRLAGARGPAVWNGWLWARSITRRSSPRWRASRQRWSRTWLECAAPDRTTRVSAHRADKSRDAVAGLESRQRDDDEGQSIGARRRCVRRRVVDGPDRADGEDRQYDVSLVFPARSAVVGDRLDHVSRNAGMRAGAARTSARATTAQFSVGVLRKLSTTSTSTFALADCKVKPSCCLTASTKSGLGSADGAGSGMPERGFATVSGA